MSLAQSAYFKAKPKQNVKVKAIASIELPFYEGSAKGEYYAGNSIPSDGGPRKLTKNGVLYSDGAPGNSLAWMNPSTEYGFRTPEEQYVYRYGTDVSGNNIARDGTSNKVSFEAIYCEWDKYKFSNFVIESLVGKALTQAIAYNYFGYPISNVSRRIDLDYDNDQDIGW